MRLSITQGEERAVREVYVDEFEEAIETTSWVGISESHLLGRDFSWVGISESLPVINRGFLNPYGLRCS